MKFERPSTNWRFLVWFLSFPRWPGVFFEIYSTHRSLHIQLSTLHLHEDIERDQQLKNAIIFRFSINKSIGINIIILLCLRSKIFKNNQKNYKIIITKINKQKFFLIILILDHFLILQNCECENKYSKNFVIHMGICIVILTTLELSIDLIRNCWYSAVQMLIFRFYGQKHYIYNIHIL